MEEEARDMHRSSTWTALPSHWILRRPLSGLTTAHP